METRRHIRVSGAAAILAWGFAAGDLLAQERSPLTPLPTAETPAYPASPFHGVTDGFGRTIPCRCRFQGQQYRLGDLVCMSTAEGVVLARCDLMLNNTSWVPTRVPCTVSELARPSLAALGGVPSEAK